MTDIEKKHLEAIEKETLDSWTAANGNDVRVCHANDLAKSCARITQRHGEIQRLEGYIFGLKDAINEGVFPGQIKELEQQLKELKGE